MYNLFFLKKVYLVEEEEVVEVIMTDEGEDVEAREVGGEGEGELNHHVIGITSGGAEKDEVRGNEEKEGLRDNRMPGIGLVDAHPPEVGLEALKYIISA